MWQRARSGDCTPNIVIRSLVLVIAFVSTMHASWAADISESPRLDYRPAEVPAAIPVCGGRCSATVLIGPELETDMWNVYGLEGRKYVPPWQYNFGSAGLGAGALSYRFFDSEWIAFEGEVGVGQRFGSLNQTEGWVALYGRWKWFPWNHFLTTTVAISTGLNYASSASPEEISETPGNVSTRLLHYLSPEITFALPSAPDKQLVVRLSHRSGGGADDKSLPVYGDLFRGNSGGTQFLLIGFRQFF